MGNCLATPAVKGEAPLATGASAASNARAGRVDRAQHVERRQLLLLLLLMMRLRALHLGRQEKRLLQIEHSEVLGEVLGRGHHHYCSASKRRCQARERVSLGCC